MPKRWSVSGRVVVLLTGLATLAALVSGCALPFGQPGAQGAASATATVSAVPTATPRPINTLYVASASGTLTAFAPVSGHPLWTLYTGATSGAPIIDTAGQGILYLTGKITDPGNSYTGHIEAINTTTHQLLWTTHLTVQFLALESGVVYVSDATGIAALSGVNDARYWHYATPRPYPTAFAIADGVVYLAYERNSSNAVLDAISAGSGALLWRRTLRGVAAGSVTVSGGRVFVVSGGGGFARLVETFDASSGAPGWVAQISAATLDLTVAGNDIYMHTSGSDVSGSVSAYNVSSGAKLFTPGQQSGCYVYPPLLTDSTLYLGCSKLGQGPSDIEAFNAQTGARAWRQTVSGDAVAVAALDGGMVYALNYSQSGGPSTTTALSATNGAIHWRQGGALVAVGGGMAYLNSNGAIFAINAATGAEAWSFGGAGASASVLAV